LSNAFRHNPPETKASVTANVLHCAGHPGAQVEIIGPGEGTGLPSALLASPFEASRHHRSGSSGAGLGLSIANGIVLAHEGAIELGAVEAGTTFRIVLPVEAPAGELAELPTHGAGAGS